MGESAVRRFGEGAVYPQQILTVAALGAALGKFLEMIEADIAEPQRDLLGAGDAQSLTLFQNLNKMTGFDQ